MRCFSPPYVTLRWASGLTPLGSQTLPGIADALFQLPYVTLRWASGLTPLGSQTLPGIGDALFHQKNKYGVWIYGVWLFQGY